ncbi:ubiquitin-related domain-containing protein [Entophlyctis helioformis]|nr:ubiquitin-related domain-containing protein [Entophlyctis helioformis]
MPRSVASSARLRLLLRFLPSLLQPEPDLAKLGIRLPNGQRLIRRFRADDTVQLLCDFIETHDLSPLDLETDFVVVTPFPRKVFRDMSQTLRAAGLYPNASIVVEERIDDDL